MFIWGHRGCRGIEGIDENTLAAFAWAVENGAHGLEFDVQVSKDGVPFVFHDDTLERLTGKRDRREVQSLLWAQIRSIGLENGGSIPALSELLEFNGKLAMNMEIKSPQAIEIAVDFVRENNLSDWIVSSFLCPALVHTRWVLPKQPIGYLLERECDESMSECSSRAQAQIAQLNPERIHLDDTLAMISETAWLKPIERLVHVWTVNEPQRGRSLGEAGIAGLFTDDVRCFV